MKKLEKDNKQVEEAGGGHEDEDANDQETVRTGRSAKGATGHSPRNDTGDRDDGYA